MPASRLSRLCTAAVAVVALAATGDHVLSPMSSAPSAGHPTPATAPSLDKAQAAAAYGRLPLAFAPNVGQAPPGTDVVARGGGYSLALGPGGPTLALATKDGSQAAVGMRLVGASPAAAATTEQPLGGRVNYLVGNDPSRWHTGLPTYGAVAYRGVYPGIDARYHGSQGALEYDFTVAAGADPAVIAMGFEGATGLHLDPSGDLVVSTPAGDLRHHAPHLYQEAGGTRRTVEGHFVLHGDQVGFAVGSYDHARALVIDPTLGYSTYLGGSVSGDVVADVAVDSAGDAYVVGATYSTDFPTTPGAFQTTITGDADAFVTKLNPTGSAALYSTFLGGSSTECPKGFRCDIAIDAAGDAYVSAPTNSSDFPTTPGAFQTTSKGSDSFVAKLNPTGSALLYSTYLGGSGDDLSAGPGDLAVNAAGEAYVTGYTSSTDFPTTPGAFQTTAPGNGDAFVTKLNASGSALVYSTYVGGSGADNANGIALDSAGDAYLTGDADPGFPTTSGAFQPTALGGGDDVFVAELNPGGSGLVYGTYLGGTGFDSVSGDRDEGGGIAVDPQNNAYVVGVTTSTDFPTTAGAFQPTAPGNVDAFVTKLNAVGSSLGYSTYLGGTSRDRANGVAVDASGAATVAGYTDSTDFPTVDPLQAANAGGRDAFVTTFDPSGAPSFSTYLGGSDYEVARSVALGPSSAFVVGHTESPNFPTTPGVIQPNPPGNAEDGFVSKIVFRDLLSLTKAASPTLVAGGQPVTYTLTVRNDGSVGTATGVKVTDPLPAGTTFVSATSSKGTCAQTGGTVTCTLGKVPANSTVSVTITVTAPNSSTTLTNTATVSARETDPNPADNTATAEAYVNAADLSITKTASPSPAIASRRLTYTLVATNAGPAGATGVTVTDPLPPGVSYKSATSTQGTCTESGGTVTCRVGRLGVGSSATVTVAVIAPGSTTSVVNTGSVSARQVDQATGNNTAAVQTSVLVPNCGLVLTRSKTLAADIGPCPGTGVIIGADNITLDLNGHHIFGSGPTDGTHPGIDIEGHTGVTVKNGEVSGFDAGVFIRVGGYNTATNLNIHDNIGPPSFDSYLGDGIAVFHSAANQIVGNTLTHNGVHDGIGVLGLDANSNVIQGNTVKDTVASPDGLGGEGIAISAVLEPYDPRRGLPVTANHVKHNKVFDNAGSGISLLSDTQAVVAHNDVERNGVGSTTFPRNGIEIRYDVDGGANLATQDTVRDNTVVGNGDDGIVVMSGSNTITYNTSTGNDVNHAGFFDLHDTNPNCDANRWNANTWGSAGYSAACVSNGGSGPPPGPSAQSATAPPGNDSRLADLRAR